MNNQTNNKSTKGEKISEDFFQVAPTLKNTFESDPLLKKYLQKKLSKDIYQTVSPELKKLGDLAVGEMLTWAWDAEKNPPRHIPYDPWGRRIDEIQCADGWKQMESTAARFGIVAAGYERTYGEFSRIFQMSLLYLYHPSSAFGSCPLAMTDGATRAIELYGNAELKSRAFQHLTSRDPQQFWTSGQWMTEKTGGSDVSGTLTKAVFDGHQYRLYGTKWFTSATTSPMAMTLARIEGAEPGSRGLSLFYLETKNSQGSLNNILIHRLKDKMGTKALPTAELTLDGTPAQLVGGEGHGVRKISSLFNITRIYNAICAVGQMRRALDLSQAYSNVRSAFGKRLIDHPLHQQTLLEMELEWKGSFLLVMRACELLGKDECGKASEQESSLLRVLTPLAKLYTGKAVVRVCSEALECFGGAGYVEDTGLPRLLRDGQVLSIWEGTTNVLSLDMLRAFEKEKGFEALQTEFQEKIASIQNSALKMVLQKNLEQATTHFQSTLKKGPDALLARARHIAMNLTQVYIEILIAEFDQN
ncbi:MAG: acyl-CoA dehydrogenase [Bdellovibrio sp. CG10_big_fil_rev_8_21_14_0_10_47_8]|nr:MAG: acyl-CoA dehydrogenase [Bdellovibrio sp. CG10_big_fil_rev_8_21_14_0_10_47_8]